MKTNLFLLSFSLISFIATADTNIKPPPGPYISKSMAMKLQQVLETTVDAPHFNSYPEFENSNSNKLIIIPQAKLQKPVISKNIQKEDAFQKYPRINQQNLTEPLVIKNKNIMYDQKTNDNTKNFWDVDPKFLHDENKESHLPKNKFLEYPPL